MLRVFVKNEELTKPTPMVLASYDEATPVEANAHGMGVVNFLVLQSAIKSTTDIPPRHYLAEGWRTVDTGLGVNPTMRAEAQRRINAVFPLEQRIASVHELLEMFFHWGSDQNQWPQEVKTRRAELERLWHYVGSVNEAAASHHTIPNDPTSDALWPTRIT